MSKLHERDLAYTHILLAPLIECARYKPAFGRNEEDGIDIGRFRVLYGGDPLYHWVGLDSDLMYAAHKAAGGMTSIYRQLGIGCERLLRRVMQDEFSLSDSQVRWSYEYQKGEGQLPGVHTLDAKIASAEIVDSTKRLKFQAWVKDEAIKLGLNAASVTAMAGAAFEIRQGYKSADSKRQNADLRFGLRAYSDANLLPVICIVSTQASDTVCRRYKDSRLLVLRGTLDGEASTFGFFREVVGYDLADYFRRNSGEIRRRFTEIIQQLLTAE